MSDNYKWYLKHAVGYIDLGMFEDAESVLMEMPVDMLRSEEALAMFVHLYHETKDWDKLLKSAEDLIKVQPDNPGGWVSAAYAMRRINNVRAARRILLEGEERHPQEPTIQYNLGCYASLLGDMEEAEVRVNEAIAIDESFKKTAREDEDLEALRDSGVKFD